ncbi:transposase, partial [Bacillus safensis]
KRVEKTAKGTGNYVSNMNATDILWKAKSSSKGNTTIGSATRQEAWEAGKAWVGPNANPIYKKKTSELMGYNSLDGSRTFRLDFKPRENMVRANFQEFTRKWGDGKWIPVKNAHIDIK